MGLFFRLPDLRQYRLDFSTSSPRAARLASDCLRIRPDLKFADMHTFLREHPEVLRPVPSYFEVELTTRCGSKPAFWPSVRPATDIDLPLAMAEKLNKEIRDASWPGDATVALGGLGDPLLHPDFTAVARTFLENPNVGRLYVETFGDTLVPEFVRQLENLPGSDKLHVIVRLSTLDRVRYRQIYGTDHLLEALANLEAIEKAPPAFTVYVEMVRMTDVEDEIGRYYDRFEKSPLRIIIQKFNRYVDQLPEKRVSDLTPLHRDFCWHLARDMYVTAEGKIPLCRQDPRADRSGLSLNLRDAGIGTFMDVT
ncbi:MAG: spiro-SPASM protein, partial [Spirochaetia bacterium]|nr:spiro-SPASM protein [Spirochaetia bacterium]